MLSSQCNKFNTQSIFSKDNGWYLEAYPFFAYLIIYLLIQESLIEQLTYAQNLSVEIVTSNII